MFIPEADYDSFIANRRRLQAPEPKPAANPDFWRLAQGVTNNPAPRQDWGPEIGATNVMQPTVPSLWTPPPVPPEPLQPEPTSNPWFAQRPEIPQNPVGTALGNLGFGGPALVSEDVLDAGRRPNLDVGQAIENVSRPVRETSAEVLTRLGSREALSSPEEMQQAWQERGEPFAGYKGAIEMGLDPVNLTPSSMFGKAAQAGGLRKGFEELRKITPGMTLENVGNAVENVGNAARRLGTSASSAPEAGGAVVGGLVYQDDPNLSPQENMQRRIAFAAGGAVVGNVGRRLGNKSRLGGTIEDVGKVATQAERDAAKREFERKWAAQYGNRPETMPFEKPQRPVEPPGQELTLDEARKFAKMTDAELADYNAKITGNALPPIEPPKPPVADAQPPKLPPERPGFAGNIRLEKFPEALRNQIKATYDADPVKFEEARRGVIPDAQVKQEAAALIDSVGGNGAKSIQRWKPGQAWNAEEVLALKEVLGSRTRAVIDAQKAVREGGDSTASLVRLQLALKEQDAAQRAVSGVTAEAGRALRVMRQTISGALESKDERALREILDRLGGRQNAEEMAGALSKIDLEDREAVYKFIRSSQPSPEYITEIFYNSILSSTGTHLRNAIGNTLAMLMAPIETATAAAVDVPLSAIQRRPRERFFGEVPKEVFGLARATKEGVSKALYIAKNGYSWDDVAQLEMRRPEAFQGKPGAVINAPSRALVAADAITRSMHYSANLNAGAYRMASKEGLKGKVLEERIAELLSNPPKMLLDYAGKMSRYRTYQQEPGVVAKGLTQIVRGVKVGGLRPLTFVLPFIPTPINLAKYGLERSPLGLFNPKLWSNIASKDPEAADQLARWFVGSAITSATVAYAVDGKITGPVPQNPAKRDLFYREGKQPYSVRIGDKWIPYNMAEPLNQSLALAAVAVEAYQEGKDWQSIVNAAAGGVGKNIVSQRYLTGVSDLLNAIEDPERYTANLAERAIVSLGVPFSSMTRGIAQTVDPTIRRSEGLAEEFQAVIPGLSQGLEPRLNAFGEEQKRETSPLMPGQVTTAKSNPIDQELKRLDVNVGFAGNSIKTVKLSPDEQNDYQRITGQSIKKTLDTVVSSPIYQNQSETNKRSLLERAIQRAKDKAGLEYLKTLGPDEVRNRLQAARKAS